MRSSTILALACGTLVAASPMKLNKKAYKYEVVTDVVTDVVTNVAYVTVNEGGDLPATTPARNYNGHFHHTHTVVSSTPGLTSQTGLVSSSTEAPVVVITTVVPAPTTSSTEAHVVVETTPTTTAVPTSTVVPVSAETVSSTTPVAVVSSTTAAAASSSPTDFDSTAVYHHNLHRANHSAPDVTYDTTLAGYAQTLSDRCSNAHDV